MHRLLTRSNLLFITAALLLLTMLGGRELWTQEHRWADIVSGMFFRHDFFHPYLDSGDYYDKPLLSYWLIALVAWVTRQLNIWALRLPSALAGLLAIWSIYRLGARLKNKQFGLLCGWLLLTTFYFVFWARVSSADMLNLAGSLLAVMWYFEHRDNTSVFSYAVFFLILALTSLCKGLVGAVVALIAIFPDMLYQQRWKKHLHWRVLWSAVPAVLVYVLPFIFSSQVGGEGYSENGLYLVYRENIMRYFHPFDHKDPIYTYFLFLPIYLLPWTVFFIPALWSLRKRWRSMTWDSRWMVWAVFSLFVFFTLSGSRRSYYVLPIVPFAILMIADWVSQTKSKIWIGRLIICFLAVYFIYFGMLQPLFYAQGGQRIFAQNLQAQATQLQPWSTWQVVLLDPDTKIVFHLHLSPEIKNWGVIGARDQQTTASLQQAWPMLKQKPKNVIYITRKAYVPMLQPLLVHYQQVVTPKTWGERLFNIDDMNEPVAFISR